jgi:hypothetical protein
MVILPTPTSQQRGLLPAGGFSLASSGGRFAAYSPFGLETGLDYFYKPDRYVSLSLGGALGFPGGQHGGDSYKTAGVLYANLRNNYNVGSFDLGYGVNVSRFHLISNTLANTNHDVGGFGPSLSALETPFALSLPRTRRPLFDFCNKPIDCRNAPPPATHYLCTAKITTYATTK